MRTVIIDDDMFFSELLSNKLKTFGLSTVKKVENLEELKSEKMTPDVFFIDFHLKESNCNNIIKYIEENYKNASIIVMSDNDNAVKLLNTKKTYYFLPKSKIGHLKYKIYSIKESILSKQQRIFLKQSLYYGIGFGFIYLLVYYLLQ